MTEEILQAAIMRLKSSATERFAIIKDLYHRPATIDTVEQITQHAIALAQLEGAMVTLQQYAPVLAKQTDDEAQSNEPDPPTEVEVEEDDVEEDEVEPDDKTISHDQLVKRSTKYRNSTSTHGTDDES